MSLARALMQRPRGGSGGEDRSTEFWSSWGGAWGHMLTLPFWKKETKPLRKERKNQFSRRRPSPLSSYLFVLIRARNYRFLAMSWRFVWRPPLLGEAGDPDYAELSVRQGHLLAAELNSWWSSVAWTERKAAREARRAARMALSSQDKAARRAASRAAGMRKRAGHAGQMDVLRLVAAQKEAVNRCE